MSERTALPVVNSSPDLGKNIDYQRFMDCVHCGLCLGSCPTYVETGNENDSPRGRIYLWRAVADGRAELTPEVEAHLDQCLECKACETACPSGVQYGKIIGGYKKDMARTKGPMAKIGWFQRWMVLNLTPYASRMRWALWPMRIAHRLGLEGFTRWVGGWTPAGLRRMQEILPRLERDPGRLPELLPAEGKKRGRVALLTGCAADAFFPQTTWATARVLQKNGVEVWVPRQQNCCGALHWHSGMVEPAQKFARGNCSAFGPGLEDGLQQVDAILNNAGGCGPVLKEYGEILHGTADESLGKRFAKKVKDVHEFLAELGPIAPTHPLPIRATYHDACGLAHAQKIRQPPRVLLNLIPGLELVSLPENEHCCGAAGSYNITQPEMSAQLGARKAKNVESTKAQAVFVANVGCQLQILRHLRDGSPNVWVAHPMDALWASYSGEMPSRLDIKPPG